MPRFLDSECIRFLLEYAKLDIKRNELHTVLKEMKFKGRLSVKKYSYQELLL